jgi:hypothetical protein
MIFEDGSTMLIRRHKIKLGYIFGKFFIAFIIFMGIIVFSSVLNTTAEIDNFLHTFIIPASLFIINVAFLIFIYDIIGYYNNIIIIDDNHIVIIQNSVLFREDIEIIDMARILKINIICQ